MILACGCVLGYERCFDCRPGLHLDQEKAIAMGTSAMTDNSEQIRWLRDLAKNARHQNSYTGALNAAADEIERLSILVRDLSELVHSFDTARASQQTAERR